VERLYTVKAASEVLGVHVQTVYVWIKEGRIRVSRLGKRAIRIRECDLQALLMENEDAGAASG
jgi:putative resolvase